MKKAASNSLFGILPKLGVAVLSGLALVLPALWSSNAIGASPTVGSNWLDIVGDLQSQRVSDNEAKFRVSVPAVKGMPTPSVPSAASAYRNTQFVVSPTLPRSIPAGAHLVTNVRFGYRTSKKFLSIGPLSYVLVGVDGSVIEVGGITDKVLKEFESHVDRRVLSAAERARIVDLNTQLFADLSRNPKSRAEIAKFEKDRGWPEGYGERAGIVFYSSEVLDLRAWAKAHRYSLEDMEDAGWCTINYDAYGRPYANWTQENAIKIPFFTDAGRSKIARFRSRLLNQIHPKGTQNKYRSPTPDRSVDDPSDGSDQFYDSWLLDDVRGKTIVITEGEFKAFIATESSGVITIGLEGTSGFNLKMARRLVASGASKFVVIFDHDPVTKNNSPRGDGVTTTQRSAFQVATILEAAGAPEVGVGRLPDEGKKLGIDDMILEKGPTVGPDAYQAVISGAQAPDVYAAAVGMSPDRERADFRQQALERSLKTYRKAMSAAGQAPDPSLVTHAEAALQESQAAIAALPPALPKPPVEPPGPRPERDTSLPPILPAKKENWQIAQRAPVDAVLQVSLRATIFDRGEDLFANLLHRLPQSFPDQELGPLRYGLRAPICEMPGLRLTDAVKLATALQAIGPQELRNAGLSNTVRLVDPAHVEVAVAPRDGVPRLGIRLSSEFLGWRARLIDLIAARDPGLGDRLRKNASSEASQMVELVDWKGIDGKPLPESGLATAKIDLENAVARARTESSSAPIEFNFAQQPVDLASRDAYLRQSTLMSFRAESEGSVRAAPVSRWISKPLNQQGRPSRQMVEFYSQKAIDGVPDPIVYKQDAVQFNWDYRPVTHAPDDLGSFGEALSPELRGLVVSQLPGMARSAMPSRYEGPNGVTIYHPNRTQADFDPTRGVSLGSVVSDISLPPGNGIYGGFAIYGSTMNKQMKFPNDSDMLYNGIIKVPSSIKSLPEALAYARRVYVRNVLGYYAQLARQGKTSILELRIGSDKTMKLRVDSVSPADAFKNHPYLTQEDFLKGRFVDGNGKTWTIDELAALDDFSKLKFDLYQKVDGKVETKALSLQFLMAADWEGKLYFLRTAALKGFPNSPIATAGYYGADAYGAGMLLNRVMDLNTAQFGPTEAASVRELLVRGYSSYGKPVGYLDSQAQLSTKFLKSYYRLMSFTMMTEKSLWASVFEDTRRLMERAGNWDPTITVESVANALLRAVNTPQVDLLNRLKSITNDLREFNERNQNFSAQWWINRRDELLGENGEGGLLADVRAAIADGRLKPSPDFLESLDKVEAIVRDAARYTRRKDLIAKRITEPGLPKGEKVNGKAFYRLEKQIAVLQDQLHTSADSPEALPPSIAEFVRTSTAVLPHAISHHNRARIDMSDKDLGLIYRLMGIDATPENIARMKQIDKLLDSGGDPAEIARLQTLILTSDREPASAPASQVSTCTPSVYRDYMLLQLSRKGD